MKWIIIKKTMNTILSERVFILRNTLNFVQNYFFNVIIYIYIHIIVLKFEIYNEYNTERLYTGTMFNYICKIDKVEFTYILCNRATIIQVKIIIKQYLNRYIAIILISKFNRTMRKNKF